MQQESAARPDAALTPITTEPGFETFGVSEPVVQALRMRGFDAPFAIQTLVIPDALAGRDILARSRTGSGKTLAFAVPIVERTHPDGRSPTALILVPTRELASQVTEEFRAIADVRHLQIASVYGGVGLGPQAKRARQADILIATPGRLLDLVARKMLRLDRVRISVLDEADRMLDMGFLPDVTRILEMLRPERQTMLFSATLDGEVGRLARAYTTDATRHERASDPQTIEEVDHRFVSVTHENKVTTLVELLKVDDEPALVFVRTKHGADRLVQKLRRHDLDAVAMHGDLTQSARERALKKFDSGQVRTLVATDVAARGLDLDRIATVINFDPPEDNKGYIHRVGRTGRAGRSGTGVTLVLQEQQVDVSRIAAHLELGEEFKETGMKIAAPRLVYTSRRGRGSKW
jgi:ATP-dependent RNA helicase RhlE